MASATQIAALSVTHQHFEDSQTALLKQNLNNDMLEMERKSMAAEDARAHLLSPYDNVRTTDPRNRPLTWKDHALDSDAMIHHITDTVITPARFFRAACAAESNAGGDQARRPNTARCNQMSC